MLLETLDRLIDEKQPQLISIRRYLHQHPELSFQETETHNYIKSYYQNLGLPVQTFKEGYGLKVVIDTLKPGKNIALRADFDALPIFEETGLEFSSLNPGVSHACGHDGHTAYLLILADVLNQIKQDLVGKITLIHQPAEEVPPGGAKPMIDQGVLTGVDAVFGLHLFSNMDYGNIYYHRGLTMSARAKFSITIQGKGGHGAIPQEANDAIVAASHLVVALQTIVSRRLNPFETAVITIGDFRGEGQFNIIKDTVTLVGDVRFMKQEVGDLIEAEIQQIVAGIGNTFKCKTTLDYENDYPAVNNDANLTDLLVETLSKHRFAGLNDVLDSGPLSSSEDFAYYSLERPSVFFFVGAKPEGPFYPHHHPKFNINEGSLSIAAKAMGRVVLAYLGLI